MAKRKKHRGFITKEERDMRVACCEAGMTADEAAQKCGCSVAALTSWSQRNGYNHQLGRKNGRSKSQVLKVKAYQESGMTYSKIADMMGFSGKTVVCRIMKNIKDGKYKKWGI